MCHKSSLRLIIAEISSHISKDVSIYVFVCVCKMNLLLQKATQSILGKSYYREVDVMLILLEFYGCFIFHTRSVLVVETFLKCII